MSGSKPVLKVSITPKKFYAAWEGWGGEGGRGGEGGGQATQEKVVSHSS